MENRIELPETETRNLGTWRWEDAMTWVWASWSISDDGFDPKSLV
jgi:hypothetical protein